MGKEKKGESTCNALGSISDGCCCFTRVLPDDVDGTEETAPPNNVKLASSNICPSPSFPTTVPLPPPPVPPLTNRTIIIQRQKPPSSFAFPFPFPSKTPTPQLSSLLPYPPHPPPPPSPNTGPPPARRARRRCGVNVESVVFPFGGAAILSPK